MRPSPEGRTLYCLQFSSRFWDLGILPHTERKMSISLALLVLSPAICSKIRQRDLRYCRLHPKRDLEQGDTV